VRHSKPRLSRFSVAWFQSCWPSIVKLFWRQLQPFLSRTLLRYVRLMAYSRPSVVCRLSSVCLSVCRLSSVTLLHHRHRLELSGNIFTPPNSSGTWTLCVKILNKNLKGFRGIVQVKYKGVWKIGVFRPISRFISKMVEDTADERRIVTRMRSIEWCHLQWPWWPLT